MKKSYAAITKMILDAMPRNLAPPFEMAQNTLRWEPTRSRLTETHAGVERAFRENPFVKEFDLQSGPLTGGLQFIEVTYTVKEEP